MISDYIYPQLRIKQTLQTVDAATVERMNTLVIGPQFAVANLETDDISKVAIDEDGGSLDLSFTQPDGIVWDVTSDNLKVDTDSVKVYVEDVEVDVLDESSWASGNAGFEGAAFTAARATPRSLILNQGANDLVRDLTPGTGTGALFSGFSGRNVQIGDKILAQRSDDTNIVERIVTGFVPVTVASIVGAAARSNANLTVAAAPATTLNYISDPGAQYVGYQAGTVINAALDESIRQLGARFYSGNLPYYGEKFTLRITSFNTGTDTGTFAYTSSLGYFSGTGTFAIAGSTPARITFTLANLFNVVYDLANATLDPTVGEEFVVTVQFAYVDPVAAGVVTRTGTYTGTTDNIFYARVKTGRNLTTPAVVTVYDANGKFPATDHTVANTGNTSIVVGDGITITFVNPSTLTQEGLNGGDVFYVPLTAAKDSTTKFKGVTLDGPVRFAIGGSNTADFKVKVRKVYSGIYTADNYASGDGFNITSTGVTYDAAPTLFVSSRSTGFKYIPLVDGVGSIYATFRGLVPVSPSDGAIIVDSSDFEDVLGRATVDNDLSYGVLSARKGAQDKRVYALRTSGYAAADFTAALKKVERNDLVYALAPMTDDLAAIIAVKNHCEAASAANVKNFRRCYFGSDSPGEYTIVSTDSGGNPYLAIIVAYASQGNVHVIYEDNVALLGSGVGNGDFIEVNGDRYEISEVISNSEIILKTGPTVAITELTAVKVIKADTAENTKEYVIARSKAVNSRRACNVWCENGVGYDDDGVYRTIPTRYIAAEVAGLRCSAVPQLGLTRVEITSVVEAPLMYTRYTTEDLDDVAANGTFIVTQELEGGEVFIRHQLTTEVSEGSLAWEDSVGTNFDNISYQFKDQLDPAIGQRNVTKQTLAYLKNKAFAILNQATMADTVSEVGPQIISFTDENGVDGTVTVKAHPTFKDRVIIIGKVEMPLPNNVTDVELEAVVGITL